MKTMLEKRLAKFKDDWFKEVVEGHYHPQHPLSAHAIEELKSLAYAQQDTIIALNDEVKRLRERLERHGL